ncbi:MAG TPA: YeeE/YedE thiosulfate transporter family protein [Bacteroidia bacterium]|nr:YeeE/YedE thiosulfate transporter family protein [Bacteroidia bacterium]
MDNFLTFIAQPWSWFVSGLLIAVIMTALLFFGKSFGLSSNLRTVCSMAGAGKIDSFFNFDWKQQSWNLFFLSGAVMGGFISAKWLGTSDQMAISSATLKDLAELGISINAGLNPDTFFGAEALNFHGIMVLLIGGLLVGFGARWAGGCTSGHAISGIANLQIPSILAVIGFFIGGLIMTHLLLPFIV